MAIVYLGLGSNKGDRVGYVQQATCLLGAIENIKIVRTSSLYETQPWLEKDTTWYVNAIVEIKTTLPPQDLLAECLRIEKQLGRNRETEGQERTIDIDILFYDKEIIDEEDLQIPHKYLHQRAFILVPMLELNPDFIHPELNKNVSELHEELENPEMVYLYGTRMDGI
ncbi:MAG: 2-amino-4-hydroxy-6-hydroxymethyldihydropteridine diphosphokinase [Candidatus Gastranaerophilales bacterium]|nr:2-amino-4-hydroxy-6-hydroxymethyldihydropteridine diphosphokinase [Candidatus Gastranaerophilales bacterium]